MKLTPKDVEKWESSLKEIEFMSADDHIVEHTKGDLWEMMSQVRGNYFCLLYTSPSPRDRG